MRDGTNSKKSVAHVPFAAPEPEVLRIIGEESQRKGTDRISALRIDQVIKEARSKKPKR
jgi:hypothetical protein